MEKNVFAVLKEEELKEQKYLLERRELIAEIKRADVPFRKRFKDLKVKARKAEKFLKDPNFKSFEDYINDMRIELNLKLKNVGLSDKPIQEKGVEAGQISVVIQTLDRIISEPKGLLEMLK